MSKTPITESPAADRPVTALTAAAAAIFTELYGQDGTTAGKLALAAGVSPSAARKALATLEEQGLARRKPGGNDGTRRLADTWYATSPAAAGSQPPIGPDDSSQQAYAAAHPGPETAVPEVGSATDNGAPSADAGDASDGGLPADDASDGAAGGGTSGARADGTPPERNASGEADAAVRDTAGPDAALPAVCPTCGHRRRSTAPRGSAGGTRLGSGQLHQTVLEHLREHPDTEWTPTGIANAIGRSAGAIANALATMVRRGEAAQVCDKPRRYRAATPANAG